jgi:hypothetical protein
MHSDNLTTESQIRSGKDEKLLRGKDIIEETYFNNLSGQR